MPFPPCSKSSCWGALFLLGSPQPQAIPFHLQTVLLGDRASFCRPVAPPTGLGLRLQTNPEQTYFFSAQETLRFTGPFKTKQKGNLPLAPYSHAPQITPVTTVLPWTPPLPQTCPLPQRDPA